MEKDDVKGKCIQGIRVKAADAAASDDGLTGVKGIALEEKAIRQCGANATVMSVLTLREVTHKRNVQLICALTEPLTNVHSDQNKCLRLIIY